MTTPGPLVEGVLPAFEEADPATEAFRAALEERLLAAPPIETVDINAMRALRARGEGVLPNAGPLEVGAWRAVARPAEGAPPETSRIRVIDPGDARAVFFNVHGGGWTFGSPEFADGRCLRLAEAARVVVASPQYRLAPEHPWPACFDDCWAALEEALDLAEGMGGAPLAIGGDSAGAHLAACLLLKLRDQGRLDRVAAAVLIYGCFDLRLTPSVRNWGARNLVLSTPIVDWFVGNLLPDRALADAPGVSPLLADLAGMPPALFHVGDQDPLLDDTLFMAERWRAAGAAATLRIWPGAFHGFDYFCDPAFGLPIARASQDETADFLNRMLAAFGAD